MESLLVLLFITGAMSSSAMGPGRLWIGTTTTELGTINAGVHHEASTVEAASNCCGKCLGEFPATTRFNYAKNISCQCLEDTPGKTPIAQPLNVIGTCGNKAFPDVTVGVDSQVAWERVMALGSVDGVEDSAGCCEECNKIFIYPVTEIFKYIDTFEARFSMFNRDHDRRCMCYSTMGATPPFTYPSNFYAGVCDA